MTVNILSILSQVPDNLHFPRIYVGFLPRSTAVCRQHEIMCNMPLPYCYSCLKIASQIGQGRVRVRHHVRVRSAFVRQCAVLSGEQIRAGDQSLWVLPIKEQRIRLNSAGKNASCGLKL